MWYDMESLGTIGEEKATKNLRCIIKLGAWEADDKWDWLLSVQANEQ